MSRGLGWIQNALLDHLIGQRGATTFETLRWDLWERSHPMPIMPGPDLPNKWNTSVMRAVKCLEKGARIKVERRRLISFDECVFHYPNKTLRGSVRRLRLQLLPALLRCTNNEGDAFPRYNRAANEKFHLQSLTPVVRKTLRNSWLRVEPRLIELLPLSGRADRNVLFQLAVKGKSIFETGDLECRGSFAEHLQICTEHKLLPDPLASDLRILSDSMLAPTDAGHLRLKSYIHTFAAVPQHRGCSLRKETVTYLDQSCPEVVRKLPGYVAPEVPVNRHNYMMGAREPKHSQQLYGLFDQTVFQRFHFLQLA
jgi:hypothetical protein